jgi:GTP-binding protein
MTDDTFSPEALEAARVLFARPCAFMMGAVAMDGLPPDDLPEVAFAGRSNVGKSSLINGLVNRHRLARASTAPGRTREINFFLLDERLRLVDLPGYGFAKVSRSSAKKFQDLGRAYLRGRPSLKRVYLLIELTKADKIKPAEADAVVAATAAKIVKRPAAFPRVIATSAEKGYGLAELRAEIAAVTIGLEAS